MRMLMTRSPLRTQNLCQQPCQSAQLRMRQVQPLRIPNLCQQPCQSVQLCMRQVQPLWMLGARAQEPVFQRTHLPHQAQTCPQQVQMMPQHRWATCQDRPQPLQPRVPRQLLRLRRPITNNKSLSPKHPKQMPAGGYHAQEDHMGPGSWP